MIIKDLQHSDYRIRKLIGTLGLLLPFMVYFAKGEFLASISHYYYNTLSSLIFIIVLSAFGLFLLSYKGYKIDTTTESFSGGFCAHSMPRQYQWRHRYIMQKLYTPTFWT